MRRGCACPVGRRGETQHAGRRKAEDRDQSLPGRDAGHRPGENRLQTAMNEAAFAMIDQIAERKKNVSHRRLLADEPDHGFPLGRHYRIAEDGTLPGAQEPLDRLKQE